MNLDDFIKREREHDERKRQALQKPKRNNTIIAMILFVILLPIVTTVHELAHALICSLDGHEYKIWFSVTGGNMACFGRPSNEILFSTAGGLFAAIVTLAPLVVLKQGKAIFAAMLAHGITQGIKALLEGFATTAYLAGDFNLLFIVVPIAVLAGYGLWKGWINLKNIDTNRLKVGLARLEEAAKRDVTYNPLSSGETSVLPEMFGKQEVSDRPFDFGISALSEEKNSDDPFGVFDRKP